MNMLHTCNSKTDLTDISGVPKNTRRHVETAPCVWKRMALLPSNRQVLDEAFPKLA